MKRSKEFLEIEYKFNSSQFFYTDNSIPKDVMNWIDNATEYIEALKAELESVKDN